MSPKLCQCNGRQSQKESPRDRRHAAVYLWRKGNKNDDEGGVHLSARQRQVSLDLLLVLLVRHQCLSDVRRKL